MVFIVSPACLSIVTSPILCLLFHVPAMFLEQTKLIQGSLPSYVAEHLPLPHPPDPLTVGTFNNSGLGSNITSWRGLP